MTIGVVETKPISRPIERCATAPRRLRVLHLLVNFASGGTERQAVELLKRLAPERFAVQLAVLRNQGPLYKEIAAQFPHVPEFPLTSFYDANFVRQVRRLCMLLQQEQIQIVHAHDFYSDMLGVIAGRLAGVKVIASQRNLQQSDWLPHKLGQRFISKFADRVLVNSHAIQNHLLTHWKTRPEKIAVIRNGLRDFSEIVDEPRQHPGQHDPGWELGLEKNAKIIGCVANLRPVKGHRYLLEAAPAIIRAIPTAHFVLLGEGELQGEIEAQATALGIKDRVHLLGYRADAARWQAAFDVSVLTSLHEGLPNTVMEAMAAGVPVVATAVGGVTELITHHETGYLVSPAAPEQLAQQIIYALQHGRESAVMAARGQHFVKEKFGMPRMLREVENLYVELAGL